MKLKDCKIGELVSSVIHVTTNQVDKLDPPGTVLGSHPTYSLILLGWKSPPLLGDYWGVQPYDHDILSLMKADYTYGWWFDKDDEVQLALTASQPVAKVWSGMACARCLAYNDYAQPNQPDGKTHICYSCR